MIIEENKVINHNALKHINPMNKIFNIQHVANIKVVIMTEVRYKIAV